MIVYGNTNFCLFLYFEQYRINTHTGKSSIMEKVLHSHHSGKIRKQGHAIIGTIQCRSIPKGRHFLCIIKKLFKSFYTTSGSSIRWRLAYGIYPDFFLSTQVISESSSYRFQLRFGIGHFIIIGKHPLCSYISKAEYRTPVRNTIIFKRYLHHAMK